MRVALPTRLLGELRAAAERGYPHEVCGFLLGRRDASAGEFTVVAHRPAENRRADAAHHRYRIDPADYRTAEREAAQDGLEIVGVVHSHPDAPARPSTYDREHAWPFSAYLIVSVAEGVAVDVAAWLLADDRASFHPLSLIELDSSVPHLKGA